MDTQTAPTDKEAKERIERIYQNFLVELSALQKEQHSIISSFRKTLEKSRLEELQRNKPK